MVNNRVMTCLICWNNKVVVQQGTSTYIAVLGNSWLCRVVVEWYSTGAVPEVRQLRRVRIGAVIIATKRMTQRER